MTTRKWPFVVRNPALLGSAQPPIVLGAAPPASRGASASAQATHADGPRPSWAAQRTHGPLESASPHGASLVTGFVT